MEEPKEFRFKCTQCGNCCKDKNTVVNLNYHDILRLKNGLELDVDEVLEILGFYTFSKDPTREELEKMVIPPIYTEQGLAFVGLRKLKVKDFACYFYDVEHERCLIYLLRPDFCRTFPFSFRIHFDKDNKTKAKIKLYYTDKGIEYCPGISSDTPLINENEWIKIGIKTIENINDDKILIAKWNSAVEERKIEPSAKNYILTIVNLDKTNN